MALNILNNELLSYVQINMIYVSYYFLVGRCLITM
jgi:hypothetical protein